MDKIIKKFNNDEYTYKLGYELWFNKVFPGIEIYKNEILFSAGYWGYGAAAGLFYFYVVSSSFTGGTVSTMKKMFVELRKYSNIPEEIEKEYESLFVMYNLNNFNGL